MRNSSEARLALVSDDGALQTAMILLWRRRKLADVELDLHEWVPDLTQQWVGGDVPRNAYEELTGFGGDWPSGESREWEPYSSVRRRVGAVLERYSAFGPVAVVCHSVVIEAMTGICAHRALRSGSLLSDRARDAVRHFVGLIGKDAVEFSFVGNDACSGIDGVAVVIDVLRAFSFAAYALDAGAERIVLMDDLDETLRLAASIPGALAAKDGVPADGFDLFNSPGQLLERPDIAGRTIVHRTGAGTVGAVAARNADHLFCASFVVAEATVDRVRRLNPASVTFVVTGDGGRGDDDLACAEYLAARLGGIVVDPAPYLARVDKVGDGLREGVKLGYRGVHPDDVDLCMAIDRFDFALAAEEHEDRLVLLKA